MKRLNLLFLFLGIFAILSAKDKIKVACVGNSITFGYLLPDREKNAYPAQLQRMLGDNYEVGNFGKNSATLLNKGHFPYIQQQEYKDALAFKGDWVVIHLGVNDTDPRDWPNYRDDFVKDYLNLIDSFRKTNPDCKIWICRLTPLTHLHSRFLSGTRDWHEKIQREIERVAVSAKVGLIDLEKDLFIRPDLFPDAVHPTAEGAGILAKTVYENITGDYGGLQMSMMYTDNMVMQRNKNIPVCGKANANEVVTITLANNDKTVCRKMSVVTDISGNWKVHLSPLEAGGPYELVVSAPSRTLTFRNILIGEVWLCSGQSNMAFQLRQSVTGKEDIPKAVNPQIRFFDMKPRWETYDVEWDTSVLDSLNRLQYYQDTRWTDCTPQSAAPFSAVAYYFGKMLADSLNVPIGLINNSVGGSTCEAWIDRGTLNYYLPAILNDWKNNDMIQDWVRGRAALNIKKSANKLQRHPYEPCYLFEAGVIPLERYPINGVIWYQGESNAHNMEIYSQLFPMFIKSWRENWSNPDLPVFSVQLSSIDRPSWPWFRDCQRFLADAIPGVEIAVSSDKGDSLDVHPRHKKEIGERLARIALNKEYGKQEVIPSGPLFSYADFVGSDVYVIFRYGEGMHVSDGGAIKTFEVAGDDGLFYPAQAVVEENNILKVWSGQVNKPCCVRYGWQPFTRANLVNEEGLPASTFRAENRNKRDTKNICTTSLSDYPVKEGISAPFAGIHQGQLIVAGGCNFPGTPAALGGKKRYYNQIYVLDAVSPASSQWKSAGKLPYNVAYGASASVDGGVVCVGGMNEKASLQKALLLKWNGKKVVVENLPDLPCAIDNAAATSEGNKVYVAGGNQGKGETKDFYMLDLNSPEKGWQTFPSGEEKMRIQPAFSVLDGRFYLSGGFQTSDYGNEPSLSTDISIYRPTSRGLRNATVLSFYPDSGRNCLIGGSSIAWDNNYLLYIGGVNYEIFKEAINGNAPADYLSKPVEWYRFNSTLSALNVQTESWENWGDCDKLARAGAGVVLNGNKIFIICGEIKPGIRTSEVNMIEIL